MTRLKVADNTGAKIAQCIRIPSGGKTATLGDVIVVTVKTALPNSKVQKGEIRRAVIVRTKKSIRRKNGMFISFGENAVVLLTTQFKLVGTRVLGPIGIELRYRKFMKLLATAAKVY